jgi:AcrR family transcriptional regulator
MSLILKKRYEAITITDICEAADVGRSSFYSHYTSKDDLKRSGLESMRRWFVDRHKETLPPPGPMRPRRFGFSLSLFEHARDHIHLYRALARGRVDNAAIDKIRQIVSDLVRGELAATVDQNSVDNTPRELVVQYVVGAYMAVLTWWLDGGAKLPPEQVDAAFRRLATDGVMSLRS